MKELACATALDLLPLYIDGLLSPESQALVKEHLESCESCREAYERMCADWAEQAEKEREEGRDFARSLKRARRKLSRRALRNLLTGLLAGAAVCLLVLWQQGVFAKRAQSTAPDGSITAAVYGADVTGLFPQGGAVTLITTGEFNSRAIYGNAVFEGMWWSPDSKRLLVQMEFDGEQYLEPISFEHSRSRNLAFYQDALTAEAEYLDGVRLKENGRPDIAYDFVQWSANGRAMLFFYTGYDEAGAEVMGYFWYDLNGKAYGCVRMENETAEGRILVAGVRPDGSRFYTMENGLDENGNVREAVFTVGEGTAFVGCEEVKEGDVVRVTFWGVEDPNIPALSVALVEEAQEDR